MKSTINLKNKKFAFNFPCLIKSLDTGNIVLLINNKNGIVVFIGEGNAIWGVGDFVKDLKLENFTPFNGTVTLSND